MAILSKLSNRGEGKWAILFNDRKSTIYLSGLQEPEAKTWRRHVEQLIDCRSDKSPPGTETIKWLRSLDDKHYNKLLKYSLCKPRDILEVRTLAAMCDYFLENKTGVRGESINAYKKPIHNLVTFFGAGKWIQDFTPDDANQFWSYLNTSANRHTGGPLSPSTATKRINVARDVFALAMRMRLVDYETGLNPFAKQGHWVFTSSNPDKLVEVPAPEVRKVMAICKTTEAKLLIALGRWGGLRIPSEVEDLYWRDVSFKEGRIMLYPSKTARYEGRDKRYCPIFPELKEVLTKHATESVKKGLGPDDHVFQNYRFANSGSSYSFLRDRCNWAGVKPWVKPWQNMRSTRETELIAEFGSEIACKWIGNTPRIAVDNYLNVNQASYDRASSWQAPDTEESDTPNDDDLSSLTGE